MLVLLSIIIPVFNIDKYLALCLNSLIHQTDIDVEIIIVNDGSSDKTGQVADSYAKKYNFIKVIHQSNKGVSIARNNGLKQALGDYVWFIDGDDLLVDGSISILHQHIKNQQSDAIFFKYDTFSDGSIPGLISAIPVVSCAVKFQPEFVSLLTQKNISYSPCDKIFRRKVLLDFNIKFKKNLISAEDYYWCFDAMQHVNRIIYIDQKIYLYRKNRLHSATTTLSISHLYSALTALEQSVEEILKSINNVEVQKNYLLYSSQLFFYNLPEFYKAGLLDSDFEKRFKVVYEIYRANQVDLSLYNRGAKVFNQLYSLLSWSHAVRLYSRLILTRRYIQLTLVKNK